MGAVDIPQYVVAEVSGGPISSQEILSSAVEKQRQTIIEGMKQDLIRDLGYSQEKINTLRFDAVGDIGIIINSKGKLNSWYKYSNGKVEYYTNLPGLDKDEDLPFIQKKSGYELIDGKLYKDGKEISQFLDNGKVNPDFVRGIDDLSFYSEAANTFGLMKSVVEGDKIEFSTKGMHLSIVRGIMRIKDVMYFYSKGYIPQEDFERLLVRAIQELPNQCSDTRFNNLVLGERDGKKVMMVVTKEELDEYLKPTKGEPLITQKMYDDCLRRIEAIDRKINEMNGVKEGTKGEIKVEKTRNGFVDRVKGILGF